MRTFALYMLGVILVAGALGYAAYLLGVGSQWIAIGVIIIVGFGIIGGARKTRPVEKSD